MNKRAKPGVKRRFVGAIVGICALLLMVPMFFTSSSTEPEDMYSMAENTLSHVRVGIKYSSSAVSEYSFTTEYGIEYGIQNKNTHEFTLLGKSDENLWSVVTDKGYYVKISHYVVGDRIYAAKEEITFKLKELDLGGDRDVFVQYNSDGDWDVRVDSFSTIEEAEKYVADLNEKLSYINLNLTADDKISFGLSVVGCNNSCVKLVGNGNDVICGYIQNNEVLSFGVRAVQPDDGSIGYVCESGKIYQGVFEFRKMFKGSYIEKIGVINVVDIEKYIAACMSYEIYPSWKHEAHQMFAIVVRTYIYGQLERHASLDFNLCTSTHCQVYRGFDRVNRSLLSAAEETAGLVVVDPNGELAHIYYYASAGGCNVAGAEAWGGSEYSYSKAVAAPWETYRSSLYSTRTTWKVEYSPYQLYLQVRDTCTELEGSIIKIQTKLCTNSPYVYSITFTDLYGNTSTIEKSNTVASVLGLNSANFVVGKAGTKVNRVVYSLDCFDSIYSENPDAYDVLGFDGSQVYGVTSDKEVLIENGNHEILTSDGVVSGNIFDNRLQIVTDREIVWFTKDGLPDVLNAETVEETVEITLTGKDGNFVFDGLGWGHGVGLSQYGANDMIELGYSPETVLCYYLPTTKIIGINFIDN